MTDDDILRTLDRANDTILQTHALWLQAASRTLDHLLASARLLPLQGRFAIAARMRAAAVELVQIEDGKQNDRSA